MKRFIVTNEDAGMRLDKFLTSSFAKASEEKGEFFLLSRGEMIRKIKSGDVFVNGKKEKPSYIVNENDEIAAEIANEEKRLIADHEIVLDVLFENDDFLIINKPAGLQVHPSDSVISGTIANALLARYSEIAGVHDESKEARFRPGIVHRLDKDTSGVMVVAKKKTAFAEFKQMFANRKVKKTYLAVVEGLFEEKSGIITAAMAKSSDYRKQVIARSNTKTKIREAITEYDVLAQDEELSLVEARPKTGRMHQIRVHLASIGHPIVGDELYGSNKAKKYNVKRQMLHAYMLEFEYFGKKYAFSAPIPGDMKKVFDGVDGLVRMHYAEKAL